MYNIAYRTRRGATCAWIPNKQHMKFCPDLAASFTHPGLTANENQHQRQLDHAKAVKLGAYACQDSIAPLQRAVKVVCPV